MHLAGVDNYIDSIYTNFSSFTHSPLSPTLSPLVEKGSYHTFLFFAIA
jgi:hypothetical protein